MKKFSIITLALNSKKQLLILSVYNAQYYKNMEHICLDGCSNDGTLEILFKYKNKYECL